MATQQLPLLLIGAIALLALLLTFWQLQRSVKQGREISRLRQELQDLELKQEPKPSFSTNLDQIEREQKTVGVPQSRADKYRYVASLADQGIDAQGIAAALQMAPIEVEQLLQLSQLKQQVQRQ